MARVAILPRCRVSVENDQISVTDATYTAQALGSAGQITLGVGLVAASGCTAGADARLDAFRVLGDGTGPSSWGQAPTPPMDAESDVRVGAD